MNHLTRRTMLHRAGMLGAILALDTVSPAVAPPATVSTAQATTTRRRWPSTHCVRRPTTEPPGCGLRSRRWAVPQAPPTEGTETRRTRGGARSPGRRDNGAP